jgi:hypothetical protein
MVEATLIASYLSNLQPGPVRNKLLDDPTFGAHFGLVAQEVITLGPDVHINLRQCYAAVRRAFTEPQPASLLDIQGHEILVKIEQGHAILEVPSRGRKAQVNDFMCLSPNHEERTRALRQLIDRFGPTAPDFSALLTRAEERELSDHEIDALFTETTTGVGALQRRARSAFQNHQATLQHLVPDSLGYFERFCGPDIASADHEEYFHSILPRYRRELVRRDLIRGLDICLQGPLRDDLMPGVWTEHIHDDKLWEALAACDPWSNPFALLGALDIAIGRQHDERYRAFAEEAVRKLVQEDFPRPDGIDTYEILPLWAELVLNRLNGLDGGALRPPCWKRMCAWMQAGFLVRLTHNITLELESVREWVQGHRTLAGMYAKLLDLRHEPMYRAAEMSRGALREEVIGRLMIVRERHSSAGRIVPGSDSIGEAVTKLVGQGMLGWAMPGPLDGHCRPAEIGKNRLSEHHIEKLAQALANDPDTSCLSTLAYLSQRYDLGQELLVRIREIIGRSAFASEEVRLDERISRLIDAGLVAGAQRDEELATVIASTVVGMAHRVQSGSETIDILRALLVAAAAFQCEDAWAEWLERQLSDMASRLPAGEPSRTLFTQLQELKEVLKLQLGIHIRAEALASAAN